MPTLDGMSNEIVRVVGRQVTITDNGDLSVQLSLGRLPLFTTGAAARDQAQLSSAFRALLSSIHGGTYA